MLNHGIKQALGNSDLDNLIGPSSCKILKALFPKVAMRTFKQGVWQSYGQSEVGEWYSVQGTP